MLLIRKFFLIILLILWFNPLYAQNINIVHIAKWAYNKSSAFSFTFDDGLKTHYTNVKPILNQFDFKGTFFLLPPYLTETEPTIWRYGTWPMFQELGLEGHEIGSHTLNHLYLTNLPVGDTLTENTLVYELYFSRQILQQRIPNQKCITLAYPFADHNSLVDSVTKVFYEAARAVGPDANNLILSESEFYSLQSYPVHFSLPRNTLEDDLDELYSFMNWTETSINNNSWAIMMVHDVVPFSELGDLVSQGIYEPISNEWFTQYCEWLKGKSDSNFVWIAPLRDIMKYLRERQNVVVDYLSLTDSVVVFNLSDNLNDEIYNFPLTCLINVPENYNAVFISQNNIVDTLYTFQTDSGNFVQTNLIPDHGFIIIKYLNVTSVDEIYTAPLQFTLEQNYPNPFNPSTIIRWQTPVSSWQTIKLYDLLGREIETIVDGYYEAGYHSTLYIVNSKLSSGVYFYRLQAGNFTQTKKMILIR